MPNVFPNANIAMPSPPSGTLSVLWGYRVAVTGLGIRQRLTGKNGYGGGYGLMGNLNVLALCGQLLFLACNPLMQGEIHAL